MSYCVHRGMALSFRSTGCRNHFKQELGLDDNISSPLGKTSGESWMKRGGLIVGNRPCSDPRFLTHSDAHLQVQDGPIQQNQRGHSRLQ